MKRGLAAAAGVASVVAYVGVACPLQAHAQEPQGSARLAGVVYDSTAMRALAGARVAVLGTRVVGETDAAGRFVLDGVPDGSYRVSFYHPRLGELGIGPPSMQMAFQAGHTATAVLTVPSERTLLMGWCLAEQAGLQYGALAGTVVDSLTGVPVPGAVVQARLAGRRPGDPPPVEVRTDDAGYYRLCTVPVGREVRIDAHFGDNASQGAYVAVQPRGAEIQDLVLFFSTEATLRGAVLDHVTGRPLAGAEVTMAGAGPPQRTNARGGFVFREVPPGRYSVTTARAGYRERADSVTLYGRETVDVELRLSAESVDQDAPLLETARTRSGRSGAAADKRANVLTRAQIEPLLAKVSSLGELFQAMDAPGLNVTEVVVTDASGAAVPGWCLEVNRRTPPGAARCAMAAVYVNDVVMPYPNQILGQLSPASIDRIEVLSPTDAVAQFGQAAADGAVLIYTR